MQVNDGRLNDVALSKEQHLRLFALSMEIVALFRHDAGARLQNASGFIRFLQQDLESLQKDSRLSPDLLPAVLELASMASMAFQCLRSFRSITASYFDKFGSSQAGMDLFIARPGEIVDSLKAHFDEHNITVGENSLPSLSIVYPRNNLFGILLELADNATKSAPGPRTVMFCWKMAGNRFECEIHDDGPGIHRNVGDKFAPLSSLTLSDPDEDADGRQPEGRGLRVLERMIDVSDGILLFSNSPVLGGTLVRFTFPVDAYKLSEDT